MPYLAFDSETTGLPDWRAPSDAAHQPHLVQLAMILLDDNQTEQGCFSLIVRPDGWTIPDEVAAIHGITTEHALKYGVPEKLVTDLYVSLMYGIAGVTAIGHNVKFDHRIMRIAMLRAGHTKEELDGFKVDSYCTMLNTTHLLKLPPTPKMVAAGFTKPKPPKLEECIQHFFGEKLEGAHDALVDVRACLRVYRHLNPPVRPPIPMHEPIGTDLGAEDIVPIGDVV